MRELNRRKDVLRKSEGALITRQLEWLHRSFQVFMQNTDELLRLLHRYTDDDQTRLQLMSIQNRAGFERFLDEVDRLLHNVLAAVASLREHTRRAKRKYLCSDELGAEYDARVADVFLAPKAQFVQRLRVMVAHRNLPRLLGYTSVVLDESFTSNIILDRDELLEWDDWGVTAQAFLEGSEEPIALDEVIVECRAAVIGFHEWFTHALTEKNREALKEYERASEDLLAFTKTLWGPMPR